MRARGEQEPRSGRFKTKHWQREHLDYPVYFFQFHGLGATAKIVKNFLERLLGITLA